MANATVVIDGVKFAGVLFDKDYCLAQVEKESKEYIVLSETDAPMWKLAEQRCLITTVQEAASEMGATQDEILAAVSRGCR